MHFQSFQNVGYGYDDDDDDGAAVVDVTDDGGGGGDHFGDQLGDH